MEWLSQNWIWLALGVGMVLMMRRGGAGGCCGGTHDTVDKRVEPGEAKAKSAATPSCCGGHDAKAKPPVEEAARP